MCFPKNSADILRSRSQIFFKIGVLNHMKTPLLESLFNKVARLNY